MSLGSTSIFQFAVHLKCLTCNTAIFRQPQNSGKPVSWKGLLRRVVASSLLICGGCHVYSKHFLESKPAQPESISESISESLCSCAKYKKTNMFVRFRSAELAEKAWPSGLRVGLIIRRSRVRCTEFKSSATLVNSQLVCLQPFEILNNVLFSLNYLFQLFSRPH